jgi:hypothetical protein
MADDDMDDDDDIPSLTTVFGWDLEDAEERGVKNWVNRDRITSEDVIWELNSMGNGDFFGPEHKVTMLWFAGAAIASRLAPHPLRTRPRDATRSRLLSREGRV